MNKIVRYFNQNRQFIISIIVIIIACFIGLQLVNYFVRKQNEENLINISSQDKSITGTEDRDYQIAEGETRDEVIYKSEKYVIEEFISNCNAKKFEDAYSLLTQNCKDLLYPDLATFVKQYGQKNFATEKDYNIQAWSTNIYRVKLMENLLANGKTADTDYIEQYFTVYNDKINIGSYVGTKKLNKTVQKANVEITLEKLDSYIDYSIVTLKIVNNRDSSIMLNTRDYADNIYLLDKNKLKYVAFLHELNDDEFIIGSGSSKTVSIKFDSPYTKADEITSLCITNMISNYEQYQQLGDSRLIQFFIEF